MTSNDDARYCANSLKRFIGYTVAGVCETPPDNDADGYSYGLILENKATRALAWVDCDPEGNGPGFLSIERVKS